MINKLVSIFLGIIFGIIIYVMFKKKNTIILNYNFDVSSDDNIRINNKCYKST